MGKIGQSTKLHQTSGADRVSLGRMRCYSCGRRIFIRVPEKIQDFYWKGNMYDKACYLQVSHGIELPKVKKSPYFHKCSIEECRNQCLTSYHFCFFHSKILRKQSRPLENLQKGESRKLRQEITNEIRRKKETRDPNYSPLKKKRGILKQHISFCQNISCPDRKPMEQSKMITFKPLSGDSWMYFCSLHCKFIVKGENPELMSKERQVKHD